MGLNRQAHKPGIHFTEAAKDYLLLLEKKYPQKAILNLVGDRYKLSGLERSMLYRGITTHLNARSHSAKQVGAEAIPGNQLHIDGYNCLISIGSYLNGNLVFLSNDKFLRDAAEMHGKVFRSILFDKAILLIFSFLDKLRPSGVQFYLDEPVSHSGDHCKKINELIAHYNLSGHADTYKAPDYHLKKIEFGLLATSNSGIIAKCLVPVVDLPALVIHYHYHKTILDICEYLNELK
jgi:hypothetical protein